MDLRFRLLLIMGIGALVAAVWTFPTWYPLLNQETLTEYFPGLALESQPDFVTLPGNVQQAYFALREDENTQPGTTLALVDARLNGEDTLSPEADQPFTPPSNTIVRRGEFLAAGDIILLTPTGWVRGAQGEVTIYQLPNLSRVMRFNEDFRATRLPGLHVILTRNPDPYDENGVGVDYIDMGELTGNVGAQTYTVPQNVDFNAYPILALYAPEYDFVMSSATLR